MILYVKMALFVIYRFSVRIVLWDGKQQYQTLYNDITERKKTEEALRESEEKYRLIVENTHDIIFIANERESMFMYLHLLNICLVTIKLTYWQALPFTGPPGGQAYYRGGNSTRQRARLSNERGY